MKRLLPVTSLSFCFLISTVCVLALFTGCSAGEGSGGDSGGDGDLGGDGDIDLGDGDSGGDGDLGGDGDIDLGDGDTTTAGDGDTPDEDCDSTVELIIRDFNASHTDFEETYAGQNEEGCGMVMPLLDTTNGRRRPTFQAGSGTGPRAVDANGIITCDLWGEYYTPEPVITGQETFDQWYVNVDGVNSRLEASLPLADSGTGTYVFDSAGTSGFFPIDGLGLAETTNGHNFHFTTEAHVRFGYAPGQKFTFSGDDDLWIFVNNKLALDLGGMHSPLTATIDFDAQAADLGIVAGQSYNMDIFHAERHTSSSNFRVETNISCFETVIVVEEE